MVFLAQAFVFVLAILRFLAVSFISFILSHVFMVCLAYAFIVPFLQTQRVFYSHLQTTLSSLVIVGCFVFSVLLLMLYACKFFEAYV